MSSHEIQTLVHEYGLWLVFGAVALQALFVPIPGTTAIVAGAIYASQSHNLSIVGVIVAGALGVLAGTCGGYLIGHWRGERVLLQAGRIARQSPERVQRLRKQFSENAVLVIFVGRFITGVRNVSGLLAGASGMPFPLFALVSAAAAAVSCTIIGLEYYFFGHAFTSAPTWLKVVLIAVGIGATVVTLLMVRRASDERLGGH